MDFGSNRILILVVIGSVVISGIVGGFIGSRLATPPPILMNSSSGKSTSAAKEVTRSVVTVRTRVPTRGLSSQQMQQRIGCGVVFGSEGLILTNNHLVAEAKEIFVRPFGKQEMRAELVGSSKENDLALLRVGLSNLSVPTFGSSKKLKLGEPVIAIGKPFLNSENYTVTSGVVSALPVNLPKGSPRLFQTDAAINPGNSGGPLVNSKGEIIGIATAYLSTGDNAPGIGFAIPIDLAKQTAQNIIRAGN